MNLNGVEYYYIRNGQGDITGLLDSAGNQVVSYSYDTWGKPIDVSGSLASTVGEKNPYRYRGYRYDTQPGLYYLQSRYYNPEWGRFINADALVGKTGELLSHNMFTYCGNNCIMMKDPSGFIYRLATNDGEYNVQFDNGEVKPYYPSVSNLQGTILGTAIGVLNNISKKVVGYIDKNSTIHYYPKTSIAQKITPYANIAKKLSTALTVITTALDVAHTWDPMVKMSFGQRVGKTLLQLAGVGAAITVGIYISGPLLASGMALGGWSAFAGIAVGFTIDYIATATISYVQSKLYKRCGLE